MSTGGGIQCQDVASPCDIIHSVALCVTVPGPCDPEDLIDGIIFAANYLGSTQLLSDKTPSKNVRMMQAQEAVSRIKVRGLRGLRGGGRLEVPEQRTSTHSSYRVD